MAAIDLGTVLSRHLTTEGINARELARRCDLSPSVLTRILKGEGNPGPDTLRRLHQGTGIPMTTLIVAADLFTAAELGVRVVAIPADQMTNDELLAAVRERMRPDPEAGGGEVDMSEGRDVSRDTTAQVRSQRRRRGRSLRPVEPVHSTDNGSRPEP